MSRKINDVAVRVGEYLNAQGETKGRYLTIGATFRGEDGSDFMVLDAHIFHASLYALTQAAAKARDAARGRKRSSHESVMVSLFPVDAAPVPAAGAVLDDEAPF